jgi:hypothetical protein
MLEHPYEDHLERDRAAWDIAMTDQLEASFEPPYHPAMVKIAARRVPYARVADQADEEGFWITAWIIRRLIHATPRRRAST